MPYVFRKFLYSCSMKMDSWVSYGTIGWCFFLSVLSKFKLLGCQNREHCKTTLLTWCTEDLYEHTNETKAIWPPTFFKIWDIKSINDKIELHEEWRIFQYLAWTEWIEPSLLFSNFVGFLYFRRIPFSDYLKFQLSLCLVTAKKRLPIRW